MLHHDIKSANILLFSESGAFNRKSNKPLDDEMDTLTIKLADFGLASGLNADTAHKTLLPVQVAARCHIYHKSFDDEYNTSSVYSYGILLWNY